MTGADERIVHDEGEHHGIYRLLEGDIEIARAEYAVTDDGGRPVMVFNHTYTVPERRGHGHADTVVRAALDDVRSRGGRVVARCWFVADYIRANDEYADLLR